MRDSRSALHYSLKFILQPSALKITKVIVCFSTPVCSTSVSFGKLIDLNLCTILTTVYATSVSAKSTSSCQPSRFLFALKKKKTTHLPRQILGPPLKGKNSHLAFVSFAFNRISSSQRSGRKRSASMPQRSGRLRMI